MSAPPRILVVDDSPDDRALAVRGLRREFPGLPVMAVGEATGLAKALEAGGFDLVITDYYLGWTTGLAVLRAVKARWPDCPVIMFTGTGSEEIAVEAMKAGLDDYILKSLGVRLPTAARAALEQARQRVARKEAEEQLRRSREQLRALAAHLQSAREEERVWIAREIHDELGQALTALKMDISWLERKLPDTMKSLAEKTRAMSTLVDTTIQSVRKIATALRPLVLDDIGLAAAIEWQAQDFQTRTGIECSLALPREELALEQERALPMFRIFQETLTNVARHARASRVDISVKANDGLLILEVRDNGRGITEDEMAKPHSLGLLGMRERALIFGGEVTINGDPGKGTTVTVRMPLHKAGAAEGTP